MGFGEFLKKYFIPGYMENVLMTDIKERGFIGGIKEFHRRERQEDNPLTSYLYQEGKLDGKKEGYMTASEEYEKKLLVQADQFLKQKELFSQQREEYEILLSEYEAEIERLEQKQARSEAENQYLQALITRERHLRKLAC